jgi:mono/diheme cytochrome c family protein
LLLGQLDYKLRPWLRARMPGFPARAMLLAHALPLDHGFPPTSVANDQPDANLQPIGRKLLAKDGGFACTTCHGVSTLKPVGVFEAPGPNLQYVSERLTHHYFSRWVYNPLRIHKDTKMPAFADKDGKTSLRETLDGDARKQYEAIYNYLLPGRKVEPPEN